MDHTMFFSSGNHTTSFRSDGAIVVTTPLDAIMRLERRRIRTVVLSGTHATDPELAAFLAEHYPSVRVEREDAYAAAR